MKSNFVKVVTFVDRNLTVLFVKCWNTKGYREVYGNNEVQKHINKYRDAGFIIVEGRKK